MSTPEISEAANDAGTLRELAYYLGNLQHQRLNIFLVAETLLGAVAVRGLQDGWAGLQIFVATLGFIVTALIWRTIRRLEEKILRTDEQLRAVDPAYKEMVAANADAPFSTSKVHRFWLPLVFLLAWLAALIVGIGECFGWS